MNRSQAIISKRNADHLLAARQAGRMIHDYLEGRGIGHRFFGSFTKGRFHAGSDIDLLIEGEVDADARASLERRISEIADPLGIPVDILYSDDIGERNIEVLLGH